MLIVSDPVSVACFVRERLAPVRDAAGRPMFWHCCRTAARFLGRDPAETVTALLHDIIEDSFTTTAELRLLGFPEEVVAAVDLLTNYKKTGATFQDYLRAIIASDNSLALRVKYADALDNCSPDRVALLPDRRRQIGTWLVTVVSQIEEAMLQPYRQELLQVKTLPPAALPDALERLEACRLACLGRLSGISAGPIAGELSALFLLLGPDMAAYRSCFGV